MKLIRCASCGEPIEHNGQNWIHTMSAPRHPATPGKPQTPRAQAISRRDRCWLVGRRAERLDPHQAAAAWRSLAQSLEALSHCDVPKFNELLAAIRAATIRGKAPSCADCQHWQPVAEWFGMRGWGECKGFEEVSKAASFTHQSYQCKRFAQADHDARQTAAVAAHQASLDAYPADAGHDAPGRAEPSQHPSQGQNAAPALTRAQRAAAYVVLAEAGTPQEATN